MNRYRLNQILEILLFPVADPGLAVADPMLGCFQRYYDFIAECRRPLTDLQAQNKKNSEYQKSRSRLIDYLVERNKGGVKSKDDIQMLCDLFYDTGDMEHIAGYEGTVAGERFQRRPDVETISVYYLRNMARIACSLITYRDGVAAIKQWVEEPGGNFESDLFGSSTVFNKVEVWNLLCRMAVPDFFIAVAAVENHKGMDALYEQRGQISLADKLLLKKLKNGLAENHLHFKVGFVYDVVWLSHMNMKFVEKLDPKTWTGAEFRQIEMALFRCLAAHYLSEPGRAGGFREWAEKQYPPEILDVMGKLYGGIYEGDYPGRRLREQLFRLCMHDTGNTGNREYDYLLSGVYRKYMEYKTSSEFILLYQCYSYVRENERDTFFARLFIQYLRLKNDYFSKAVQNHVMQGLKYFQDYYNFTKRISADAIPDEEIMTEIFRAQAQTAQLKKLEIRIAPKTDSAAMAAVSYEKCRRSLVRQLCQQIQQVLSAYKRYILESCIGVEAAALFLRSEQKGISQRELPEKIMSRVREAQTGIPAMGIVFHFLKAEHLGDRAGHCCWRNVMSVEGRRSGHRMRKRLYVANIALALEEIRESITGMDEYIVGIDAASDENSMEPWMFVPAYKIIRSHRHTYPVTKTGKDSESFTRIRNIGFTYHVGEDFRHIVSGLRHVDEVLEGFGYKAGDRLGHALVLGTDIEKWMADNEAVPLPKQEHLENLLWMWGTNTCCGLELPIKLEVLESRIMDLASEIYGHSESLNVRMLYHAYQKKFDMDHEKIIRNILGKETRDRQEHVAVNNASEEMCYGVWTEDKLLMTNYCPVFESRHSKIELVPVKGDDVAVYKALQNYLIDKVEKRGIYIEENPTSNLTIGDFSYMKQHPIFHLNSRKGEGHNVFVTVNSDDPAVFNTNVENELAYIYYAAEAQGEARSEILEWVDKIRQYGMDASFIQNEKSAEQILAEIQQILWEIGKAEF